MAKIKSSLFNMITVLTIITALVGAIMGSVYTITAEPIAQAGAKAQEDAIRLVAPAFDNNPIAQSDTIVSDDGEIIIYPATSNGESVGAAVKSYSRNGFNGNIEIIVGFDSDGTIRGYSVLSHSETPGLGAKMEQWFRTDKNRQSIIGRNPATDNLTVSKDGGDVDAITASTITSRAFLEAVQRAYVAYMQQSVDGISGSSTRTQQAEDNTSINTEEEVHP